MQVVFAPVAIKPRVFLRHAIFQASFSIQSHNGQVSLVGFEVRTLALCIF
jgi:hypothetical protein